MKFQFVLVTADVFEQIENAIQRFVVFPNLSETKLPKMEPTNRAITRRESTTRGCALDPAYQSMDVPPLSHCAILRHLAGTRPEQR